MSKLPKFGDEEQESQYGYVHAVSGPGKTIFYFIIGYALIMLLL